MAFIEFALVVLFWAALVLALTSILTPNAAFLCRTKDRIHGLASWLGVAVLAGGLNMAFATSNTLF
ncbi:MAG TPA: hypothetical protein H9894_01625 [Candidatus Desulfovibrio intestinipullorum]|uniref:Uncharacterized protein n=1 Tax=Candidatus Desulfovibrio intestinipullorum TaxID=2838536 RepID=A0A9D1PVA4_9BACT|nr:hypothetical protein [Candidatus Desulfovibrio intestinipullorum]